MQAEAARREAARERQEAEQSQQRAQREMQEAQAALTEYAAANEKAAKPKKGGKKIELSQNQRQSKNKSNAHMRRSRALETLRRVVTQASVPGAVQTTKSLK